MRLLLILLTAHFIGDFLLQTDWMAINKSKSWIALTQHVSVYAMTFYALTWDWRFAAITFVTHFVTDAGTSRITSRLWFIELMDTKIPSGEGWNHYARVLPGRRHWFFVAIGADQLIHAWTLGLTAYYLGITL